MYYSLINERLGLLFLFIALSVRPIYKYCEYVLNFPRINITAIYIFILLGFILTNLYYYDKRIKNGLFYSFWLLLMVSLIQICSFPRVVNYTNNGFYVYLAIISQSIIQYWLFWFIGINIDKIWANQKFWKIMSWVWLVLASIIILNALTNTVFAIILDGTQIYLMLADSFAVLSIFILCKLKDTKKEILLIIIASICLFALFSRASLYCFILTSLIFLYKKNKVAMISVLFLLGVFLISNFNDNDFMNNRMVRLIFGSYDLSQSMRQNQFSAGLEDLSDAWVLGDFMGDIDSNFGKRGNYIHNYLSFWRQFGLIPFVSFAIILLACCFNIFKYWFKHKNINGVPLFLFYFTVFALSEIVVARSFMYPYIWMSIAGISTYFYNNKDSS